MFSLLIPFLAPGCFRKETGSSRVGMGTHLAPLEGWRGHLQSGAAVALVLKLAWIGRKIASGSEGGGERGIWGEKSAERNSLCGTLCRGGLHGRGAGGPGPPGSSWGASAGGLLGAAG